MLRSPVRFGALAATVALFLVGAPLAPAADPLPKFTEEREAAALYFVRKHCPELLPLLDALRKTNRPAYELQIRETFQVSELLAELDDPKRYELELRIWKAENRSLVLVAKWASQKEDERRATEEQLLVLVKELIELDVQSLEHRAELLQAELIATKEQLTALRTNFDRVVKDRFDALLEKAKRKRP